MSITSLLNVASGALLAHQKAVGIIGHNIANAETPGYTRQRARLVAAVPDNVPGIGLVGRGVEFAGVDRLRNAFLDSSWRREAGVEAQYRTLQQTLQQVTGILNEPSDAGLAAMLDQLIDSFHSLA